jgi:NAD(P)-dependent dehydrogenase (short-subunit alcohol dehydrogenase family)
VQDAFVQARGTVPATRLVVHALPCRVPDAVALADTSPAQWDAACEAVLRAALFTCIATHASLRASGGQLVFVLPLGPLSGLAGYAGYGSALEGIRGLAKSAARRWGVAGITVHCVATPLPTGPGSTAHSRWEPALGRPDARIDIARAVAVLASDDAARLTGTTLIVDGGVVLR